MYRLFAGCHISYRFLSSLWAAGVSSLKVKYDIFRNRDEGTWQKHLEKHLQHKIVGPYPEVCPRHVADGRSLYGERV